MPNHPTLPTAERDELIRALLRASRHVDAVDHQRIRNLMFDLQRGDITVTATSRTARGYDL